MNQYVSVQWKDFPPAMKGSLDLKKNYMNFPYTEKRLSKIQHPYELYWDTGLMWDQWRELWRSLD